MKIFFAIITFIFVSPTFAQVDPLLRSRGQAPEKEDLDSSRYSVRPTASKPASAPIIIQQGNNTTAIINPPPKVEAAKPADVKPVETKSEESKAAAEKAVDSAVKSEPVKESKPEAKTGVGEKVQDIILGGTQEEVDDYRKILHPYDTRLNLFELSIAPTYIYNNSGSSYWFHNYYTSGPGISLTAITWFSPFFGLQTSYISSMSTGLRADPTGSKNLKIDHQWFETGLRFRKFFGISRKSSQLSFGIDYADYQLKVPSDATQRVSSKTSGVKLSIDTSIPHSNTYSWTLGMHLMPRAKYAEKSTALDLKSGNSSETNQIGASLGGRYTFDRFNQIYWKLTHSVEKTMFSGTANTTDPLTSATPEGVSITNSFTMFSFGYVWGN